MSELQKIVGLKIKAVRGGKTRKNQKKYITAEFICFSDKKTILRLEDQDGYTYHDHSGSAKELRVEENAELWIRIMTHNDDYGNATQDW